MTIPQTRCVMLSVSVSSPHTSLSHWLHVSGDYTGLEIFRAMWEHLNIDVLLLPGRCLNVIVRKARISAPFQSRILHGVYSEWVELSKTLSIEISICSSLPYHVVNCLVWHSNAQHDPEYVENNSVRQRSFWVQLLLLQLCVVDKAQWTWCKDQKYLWFRNMRE